MKNIILSLILVILSLTLVNATIDQTHYIFNGTIVDNQYINGTTPITNVNVLGFTCSSSDCSSNPVFWFSNNTENTNSFLVKYFSPQHNFYGLYFYKNGFIPYEYHAEAWGPSQVVADANDYLYKKQFCSSNLNPLTITGNTSLGNTLTITTRVFPAINPTGPLNYVPPQIADQYTYQVRVDLYITNKETLQTQNLTQLLSLDFSASRDVSFEFAPIIAGNYTFNITTSVPDEKCMSFIPRSAINDTINIINTTIPIIPISLPIISMISPLNTTYDFSNLIVNIQTINATNVWWNNGTTNISYNIAAPPIFYNFSEGSHTIIAYANNSAGEVSANVTFFVNLTRPIIPDTTAPVITVISPQLITYNTSNISLEIITNENATAWFSFNNTNTTMTALNSTHFTSILNNLSNGNYTIIFYARDSSENVGNTSISFSIVLNQPLPDNPIINQPSGGSHCIKKDKVEDINPYLDTEEYAGSGKNDSVYLYNLDNSNTDSKKDYSFVYVIALLIANIIFIILLIRVILFKHS